MKRFIAIFITMCLVFGLSSASVWADAGWKVESTMPVGMHSMVVQSVKDKIYVIGGKSERSIWNVQIYDTKNGTWSSGAEIPSNVRVKSTSAIVDGKIYMFGDANTVCNVYDTEKNSWSTIQVITALSGDISAVSIKNKIYILNGNRNGGSSIEIFDTLTGKWSTGASTIARQSANLIAIGSNIYVVGGRRDGSDEPVDIYNIETDKWSTGADMPTLRYEQTACAYDNEIYVMGGQYGGTSLDTVEVYDTKSNTWKTGTTLLTAKMNSGSAVVNGKLYIIGGRTLNDNGTDFYIKTVETLEVGDPSSNLKSKLSVLLNTGETVQLSVSYNLENNANYTWTSTNDAVATVDSNGKVTAVTEGTADIYAESADGSFKEYIPVKVTALADELRLAVHLKTGEKAKLYLTDDATQVTWSSLDDSIASISTDGQITGVKKGLAIVQATLDGQTYQIYVRVNG